MEFGVGYFPTNDGLPPGVIARQVEQRGCSAPLFAERAHLPAGRWTSWPGGDRRPRTGEAAVGERTGR